MKHRLALAATGLGALFLPYSCGGGSGGGSAAAMVLEFSDNGFGRLLPYTVFKLDENGDPTTELIEIRTTDDLIANVTTDNFIQPVIEWPTAAKLPDGEAGNHYIHARFRQQIDPDSVLNPSQGSASSSHLDGSITVVAIDPTTGTTTQIQGQAFIGGKTYGTTPDPEDPTLNVFEQWVALEGGKPVAQGFDFDNDPGTPLEFPGLGFPGTEQSSPFPGAADLVDARSFVFIPDSDGDLSTYETFPTGVQIRMQMTSGVLAINGNELEDQAVASSTVGPDMITPEVKVTGGNPVIIPGNGDVNVDPGTTITVEFTEPVQIPTIGDLPDGDPPSLSASILVQFGPTTALVTVPFSVMPRSVFDFSSMILTPVYGFPGAGPTFENCGAFNQITISVNADQFQDLAGQINDGSPTTFFETGAGPGLVNAPVTPDAIYVGRIQADSSLSVIDLNGFGAGTGDPTFDPTCRIKEGNTNYPNNPNVLLQGSLMIPPLVDGSCPFDGGSLGPFQLTRDSSLDTRLVRGPIIESVGEMMLGHALDNVFNNGDPFGCQSGGGNVCATTGLKVLMIAAGGASTLAPATLSSFPIKTVFGAENLVSWAPHPNPPPLIFPPLCISPAINGQEPTSVDTPCLPPKGTLANNILVPGPIPLGVPDACIPPQSLLTPEQNAFFVGPSLPAPDPTGCSTYGYRQQIGHFLYLVDRVASEIVVLNSNRMTVIERIPVDDPTSLAMSPDLDFLAVTNELAGTVNFISIDPSSSSFHQVVKEVEVGKGPTGITWETGNEDIFVCNTAESSVTVISAFTLNVRKTLINQLFNPFDMVTTPRQLGFGLGRGVYFGYILNQNGTVSLFESGPDGINGWGFDEIIGQPEFVFNNPKAIEVDVSNLNSSIWIVHEDQLDFDGTLTGLGGGAVTNMFLESTFPGIILLDPGFFTDPQLREIEFTIAASIGQEDFGLTGIPTDIAFDNHRNRTALTNYATNFSAGFPLSINGKSLVKPVGAAFGSVNTPQFMFLAVPTSDEGPGVVDVINLEGGFQRFDTNPFDDGVQSIPVPGVRFVMDYIQQ